MATETLTIPLSNGKFAGDDFYVGNKNDTQYVTLTDGGNLTWVHIEKFGKDTATESGEGAGGDDEFYIDLSGFDDDFDITVMSLDPGDTFYFASAVSWSNVGSEYTIAYIGSDSQPYTVTIDLDSTNGTGIASISITCFVAGTMIETAIGPVAVEDLELGDYIQCGDGRLHPIRWIAKRHIPQEELRAHPEFYPIRIRKNAMGKNKPFDDLLVSPQHRVLLSDWRAELLFGSLSVLAPAVHLVDDNRITRDFQSREVTYYHFMFDDHQTVTSNGLETESFYPGDTAIEGIDYTSRAELYQMFPELETLTGPPKQTCYPTIQGPEAKLLMNNWHS